MPIETCVKHFQELRLVIPNSQRLNRGNYEFKELLSACRANGVTDFIVVHEHRGTPDGLIICHLVTVSFKRITGLSAWHRIGAL